MTDNKCKAFYASTASPDDLSLRAGDVLTQEKIDKIFSLLTEFSNHRTSILKEVEGLYVSLGSTPDTADIKGIKKIEDPQMVKGYRCAIYEILTLLNNKRQ